MSILFDEMVNYAAPRAFERVTRDRRSFNQAWAPVPGFTPAQQPRPGRSSFDFDDPQQMRRRLPRLAAIFLRNGSVRAVLAPFRTCRPSGPPPPDSKCNRGLRAKGERTAPCSRSVTCVPGQAMRAVAAVMDGFARDSADRIERHIGSLWAAGWLTAWRRASAGVRVFLVPGVLRRARATTSAFAGVSAVAES